MNIIEQYGHGLVVPKDELTAIERDKLLSEGKEVDRIMCCIDTGETLAPMIGLKVRDYYFSSEKMLELEQYIYDTFHSDGAGLSTTLRGMAEAMGSKIKYYDHNIAQLETPALSSLDDVDQAKLIVEAFLHAKDKDFRIPIEFSFDINPLEVDLRDLRITSIQHEDGSGFCFNLGGTLEIFFHKTDSSHLGKFSA